MVVDNPSFYAILPADVRYAEDLTSLQKILYAEITALTNKEWDLIAQYAIHKVEDCEREEVEELSDSNRWANGFGSSGK